MFESAIDLMSFATLALLAAFYGLALPEGGNFGSEQRVAESAD